MTDQEPTRSGTASAPFIQPAGGTPLTGIQTDPVDTFNCAGCGTRVRVTGLPPFSDITCPTCDTHAPVPARFGGFLLLRLMGTGGMGGVYYARDEQLGRFVAIKVMLQSLGDDPDFIETFRREAQAVAKLNHPNIAQIYSFGEEKGQPFIVMELVSGERVDEMMEVPGGMPVLRTLRIGLEIALGLSAADEAGIVHGDIKPDNILLDTKGHAKLVDFGLATVAHQTAGEGIWGTPYYIAPEKIRRQKVDSRSDIYSLGATLYHMLTGKPPFEGETPVQVVKARLEQPPPDPRLIVPALPESVAAVILRMLALERTERYPNYLSLISDLKKALQELGDTPAKSGRSGGGKTIRFKKRASGGVDAGDAPSGGSHKMVIRKDARRVNAFTPSGGGDGVNRQHAEEVVKSSPPEPTPEEIEARAKKRKRRKHIFLTILLMIILLATAGAGTTALYRRHRQVHLRRTELFALMNARTAANEALAAITNNAALVVAFADQSAGYGPEVLDAIELLTGSRILPAPPADEGAGALPADPEDPLDAMADSRRAGDPDPPPGDDAWSQAASDLADRPPADESADGGDAGDDAPEPVTAPPDHPVVPLARNVLANLMQLATLHREAGAISSEAVTLHAAALARSLSAEAHADILKLRDVRMQMETMSDSARKHFDVAQAAHRRILEMRSAHEQDIEKRREAERMEREQQAEAERVARERRELEARTASEIQRADHDRNDVRHHFEKNNFEEGLADLQRRRENYTTEQGRNALQVHIDRYEQLVQMKAALISSMQETPFAWGWGSGSTARDIERADVRGIYVKGSRTPFPWAAVQTPQMLKMVDHYLAQRSVRTRTRIALAFGAAVYCDKFGQAGRDKARQYATRAMDLGLPREIYSRLLESQW